MEPEDALKLIRRHVTVLGEHFDSVQVFCTRHEGDATHTWELGEGSWFTRYGHVSSWCKKEDATMAERGRHQEAEEREDL